MRSPRKKAQAQGQTIDLTPMLDVVFIMLIFFIVTSSFIKEPGIDVRRTEAVTTDKRSASILVAINENNEIWIDKKQVEKNAIKISIQRIFAENPKGGMVIQADNESSVEMVGLVADAGKEVGVSDIAISTEQN